MHKACAVALADDPVADAVRRIVPLRAGPEPSAQVWDLFDPQGVYLGSVVLPSTIAPHVFGVDWFIAVVRDELDVEYVVRFELTTD